MEKKDNPISTEKEQRLIQMIRDPGYGEIRIFVADGMLGILSSAS